MNFIKIRGARVNNLKNVDLDIPINQITCFSGPSGSGKTSLAFHSLYAESKRRFLNSFPTYLKFFSERPAPVDVDSITPVLPVFGLPQINPVVGTRSSVADVMHLTELFQAHFFNFSKEFCPVHKKEFINQTFDKMLEGLVADDNEDDVFHLFISREDFIDFFSHTPFPSRSLSKKKNAEISDFNKEDEFWEIVRFKKKQIGKRDTKVKSFVKSTCEISLSSKKTNTLKPIVFENNTKICPVDGCEERGHVNITALNFSPYNAIGACSHCGGFGETLDWNEEKLYDLDKSINEDGVLFLNYKRFAGHSDKLKRELKKKKISLTKPIRELPQGFWKILYDGSGSYPGLNAFFSYLESKRYKMNVRIFIRNNQKGSTCQHCHGSRLSQEIKNFYIDNQNTFNLQEFLVGSISDGLKRLESIESLMLSSGREAKKSTKKIKSILELAVNIGLGHLSLLRKSKTVSAGEYQRLLLLKYLSYEGTGSLFIFDEPSLGLSEIEIKSLFLGFNKLIQNGNTIVLIDHNEFVLKNSDHIVFIGPGAGINGGQVLESGPRKSIKFKKRKLAFKKNKLNKKSLIKVSKPSLYNKVFNDFSISRGEINWITGSSGTGKTVSIVNVLANKLNYEAFGNYLDITKGNYKKISGDLSFEDVIIVDANLNRYTSRSTVGSMTGLFGSVRKHFLELSVSKAMGLVEGNFSYNSDLGQCRKCEGKGHLTIEMQFLEDIILECEDCQGKKLKPLYADISDGEMTVHEAFSKPLNEFISRIRLTPKFQKIVKYMEILNLDYLSLNRQINSLSGGEKQRIYLLNKLQKNISNSILIFENISFGLSNVELEKLCQLLNDLVLNNNTIILIDQNKIFEKISGHIVKFD